MLSSAFSGNYTSLARLWRIHNVLVLLWVWQWVPRPSSGADPHGDAVEGRARSAYSAVHGACTRVSRTRPDAARNPSKTIGNRWQIIMNAKKHSNTVVLSYCRPWSSMGCGVGLCCRAVDILNPVSIICYELPPGYPHTDSHKHLCCIEPSWFDESQVLKQKQRCAAKQYQ